MKNDYTTRILCERDRERNAADLLATQIMGVLDSKNLPEWLGAELTLILVKYCNEVGYNGPAGSWSKWLKQMNGA